MGRKHTEESKRKLSIALKNSPKRFAPNNKGKKRVHHFCKDCHIELNRHGIKYCDNCRSEHIGGYREGSGRAKSGYYRGYYCGSTYELCWLIYELDSGRTPERFQGLIEHNGVKYIPDFKYGTTIIEIKGYEDPVRVEAKTKVAEAHGYQVVVLRKEDLLHCFDWVSKNYTSDYHRLYDGYKPKYSFICEQCKLEFHRDKKNCKFCSRSCSMKYNRNMELSSKGLG
jgi:hypothetical protein